MVRRQLSAPEETHGIRYTVVPAYLPKPGDPLAEDTHTVYPEGMETVPPRFAISMRNCWMLRQCSHVVTYVRHAAGGAAQFKSLAEKHGKTMVAI